MGAPFPKGSGAFLFHPSLLLCKPGVRPWASRLPVEGERENPLESALLWFSVVATVYGGPGSVYDGQPLYCAGADGPYYTETTAPWVAVDVRVLNNGRTRCGDMLSIRFDDGLELIAQAMERTGGVQKQAAKLLGISVRSLRYRLEKLDNNS